MQTVSEAWKANQNALVRSQGFVNITLGDNQVIPPEKIKELIHSRSYDPMSFELPTNNITIDIFNFDGTYTQLYEDYAGERIKVTVQYGYYFNGTPETIPGGVFWTTDISFADNILTIVADCSLALMDGDEEFSFTPNNNDRTIWEGEQTEIMYYETDEFADGASFGHYLDKILLSTNVTIIASDAFKNIQFIPVSVSGKKIEILQMMVNASQQKFLVGRNDIVYITDISSISDSPVLLLNCTNIPTYSVSKKVRNINVSANRIEDVETKTYGFGTKGGGRSIEVDVNAEIFKSLKSDLPITRIEKNGTFNSYSVYVKSTTHYTTGTLETFVLHNSPLRANIYNVSDTGEICDVTNSVIPPISINKISNYFANRKLYDFELRGDPARDVGDYVMVSLTDDDDETTYKKALILSSELRFDGSFKENLTVRIIETEFE